MRPTRRTHAAVCMLPDPKTYALNAPEECHSLLRLEFILRENALFHRKPAFRCVCLKTHASEIHRISMALAWQDACVSSCGKP
ncbi:hypothetical protein L596_022298 [Steinernema carpocapsae]|uniref:Uncharacterized protein n=1 Tax=Steinernema carpocapsae TaxID=34508 RepID=A0A4U5MLP3_STECR|nr:hypothetical protein L596_022298 [Steinernema carpocapsae]